MESNEINKGAGHPIDLNPMNGFAGANPDVYRAAQWMLNMPLPDFFALRTKIFYRITINVQNTHKDFNIENHRYFSF